MSASRRWDFLINLFLWLAPLGGAGWICAWVPRHEILVGFINEQGTGVWAVPPRVGIVIVCVVWASVVVVAIVARRKLGFVAGVSFVLLLVSAGMWVRSHSRQDYYCYFETSPSAGVPAGRERIAHEVKSTAGAVRWMRFQYDSREPKLVFWETWTPEPFPRLLSGKSTDADRIYPSLDFEERHEPRRLREWGFDLALNPGWARDRFSSDRTSIVAVPFWFLCVCFLPLPVMWVWSFIGRRRVVRREDRGLCLKCGYDLRASPERCPECGLAVANVKCK